MVNNIKPFTMKNPTPLLGRHAARMTALLALLFALGSVHAQCCGRQPPRTSGAFELSAGNVALGLPEGLMNHLHVDMAWFSASRSPFKRGLRLGVGSLGSARVPSDSDNGLDPTNLEEFRYRMLLPELSGVLRFDPLRGGFRPFAEGSFGIAATFVDERNFDAAGERIGYGVEAIDPTVNFGWSAGTRIRLGRAAFLVLRYGEQQGGLLNHYDLHSLDAAPISAQAVRRQATLGISFGR